MDLLYNIKSIWQLDSFEIPKWTLPSTLHTKTVCFTIVQVPLLNISCNNDNNAKHDLIKIIPDIRQTVWHFYVHDSKGLWFILKKYIKNKVHYTLYSCILFMLQFSKLGETFYYTANSGMDSNIKSNWTCL